MPFVRGLTSTQKLVDVEWIDAVLKSELAEIMGKDLPFVMARALTWTAKEIEKSGEAQIASTYDRPKRWTTNSLFTWPSKKRGTEVTSAGVYFKDEAAKGVPAGRYLWPTISGTVRGHKGFEKLLIRAGVMKPNEYAVPGKRMPLDAYGNVSAGVIRQILSQLQASRDVGMNETSESRARKFNDRTGKWKGRRFFASDGSTGLPRGIYQRNGQRQQFTVFIFVSSAPRYRVMLPFKQMAAQMAAQHGPRMFDKSALELIRRRDGRLAHAYASARYGQ